MLLANEKSIREVIAFAKTTQAQDLMAESPSTVDEDQLDQLGISIKPDTTKGQT
jgi:aspartyl-tRNA synthetase